MKKEKYIPKESKNIIRPRIKIKKNKLNEQTSKNSISKSNTNYKTNRGLQSENNQKLKITEKLLDTNTTNEDKDLESLLTELKTTLLAKRRPNNKENNDFEDLNNIKNNNNYYLLYKNGDYIFPQKKEDNENDFIDLDLSLEEQVGGNEISQRVHTKKAKNHYEIKTKKNNPNNKNINSYRKLPPVYTSELIKHIKSNIKKGSNLKASIKKNITNYKTKKPTNMLKSKNASNSIPILDKYILLSNKIKKKSIEKKVKPKPINNTKKLNRYRNNQGKTHKNLLYNKSKIPYKNEKSIPMALKLNKTANLESPKSGNNNKIKIKVNQNSSIIFKNNSINNCRTKIKSLHYNNSYNRMGSSYINIRYKRNDKNKNKNKIRLFDYKKNNNNPFEEYESILNKSPSSRINNTYGEIKKSMDNHYLNTKPKSIYQINLKYKRNINITINNNSVSKKSEECQYNNIKQYYSNIYNKREKYKINKNKTNFIFEKSKNREDNYKNIFSINKNQFRNYNSVKNIEISI